MAIGVKVMKRPERQVSYVRATLKGMALTFKHMFEKKVTMQYPEEKGTDSGHGMGQWSISQRWRGTHRMLTDEQGRSKCVACGLCPQICPANCIKLVPGEDESGNRYPLIYEIDEFRCVFCGYCQEVSPRRPSTWGCTTRTRNTAGAGSSTTWSVCRRRPTPSPRSGTLPIPRVSR